MNGVVLHLSNVILVANLHVACLEQLVLAHVDSGPVDGLGCLVLWQMVLPVLLASFSTFSLRLVVLEGWHIGRLVAGPPSVSLSESQMSVSVRVESFLHQWWLAV